MKKIIYTLLATALLLGTSNNTAQAEDSVNLETMQRELNESNKVSQSNFSLHGLVLVGAQSGASYSLYHAEDEQSVYPMVLAQRVQFGTVWKPNENTAFNMFVRVPGEMTWGNNTRGKAFEGEEYMATKVANVDWKPTDDFRIIIGRSFYRGPDHVGFVGSPIQSDFYDGIRLLGNFGEKWSYDFIWGRNHTAGILTTGDDFSYDTYKTYMVPSPVYTFNGYSADPSVSSTLSTSPFNLEWFVYSATYKGDTFQIQPYGALSVLAKDSVIWGNLPYNTNFANLTGDTTYIYWAGFTSKVKLDSLNFGIDAVWNGNQVDYHDGGYLVDFYLRKTMKNFNLNMFTWYANGNKEDQIAGIQTVCFDGILGHVNSKYLGWGLQPFALGSGVGSPIGTTGVGFEFANFKPIEGKPFTMNANLTFINGTNHINYVDGSSDDGTPYNLNTGYASYLTPKDYVIDVGMSMFYFPQPRLYIGYEMNYLMPHFGRDGAKETKNGYHFGIVTQFNI